MNCGKVLLSCFTNLRPSNLNSVNFFHRHSKVKLYSTHTMENIYDPPDNLHGMKVLDKNAFKKTVPVSCLLVPKSLVNYVLKSVKPFLLKKICFKPLQDFDSEKLKIMIDILKIKRWEDFDEKTRLALSKVNITNENFIEDEVELNYENFSADSILKAVLPKDEFGLSSYSIIGHIIHLNIKDHLLDYKNVIGEVLLDKVTIAKTVVYKKHFIDNVYRNFQMEILCGENNLITTTNENGCRYELDFSKVYWNPRLGTEHLRIVEILQPEDVLFDVFAGIGPFAIPAGKKRCIVFANDLNPESVKWLKHNITLNKKSKEFITVFNKDGKDFILEDIRENLIKFWKDDLFENKIHVVMNLPFLAPTFIKYFKELISKPDLSSLDVEKVKKCLPIIHCYYFVSADNDQKKVFEETSEMSLNDIEHSFHFVRNVSGSSSMIRVSFTMPFEYLIADGETQEPEAKRIRTDNEIKYDVVFTNFCCFGECLGLGPEVLKFYYKDNKFI